MGSVSHSRQTNMTQSKLDSILLLCLRIGAFFCFAGWTWVHFYWEGPYGIFLWQETSYALADRFGISWDNYVGSGANDGLIQKWIHRAAWLFLACSILTLTVRKKSRFQMAALTGGSGLLAILAYAKYLAAQRQLPMFIEYGGQILIPLILVMALALGVRHRVTVRTAMLALIMTFVGHGLYALGYYWPTPANFYGMTSVILQMEHDTARIFLRIVGALDLIVCIGIFIPLLRRSCALYAAVWGLLTALARPVAGMSMSLNYWGSDQFIHEVVLRAPHFMIPLYLFFLWRNLQPNESLEPTLESTHTANPPSPVSTF